MRFSLAALHTHGTSSVDVVRNVWAGKNGVLLTCSHLVGCDKLYLHHPYWYMECQYRSANMSRALIRINNTFVGV